MNGKIIQTEWRSARYTVGFVAVEYGHYWQAYVGPSSFTWDEQASIEEIAEYGAKLSWQESQAFFPTLDITRYKTYPKNATS